MEIQKAAKMQGETRLRQANARNQREGGYVSRYGQRHAVLPKNIHAKTCIFTEKMLMDFPPGSGFIAYVRRTERRHFIVYLERRFDNRERQRGAGTLA